MNKTIEESFTEPLFHMEGPDVVRTIQCETYRGYRVSAYRHEMDPPPGKGPEYAEQWRLFFGDSPPNEYSEHWSTPAAHRTDVERLFSQKVLDTAIDDALGEAYTDDPENGASVSWEELYLSEKSKYSWWKQRSEKLTQALELALGYLVVHENPRYCTDEFVAMAAVACNQPDPDGGIARVIETALANQREPQK